MLITLQLVCSIPRLIKAWNNTLILRGGGEALRHLAPMSKKDFFLVVREVSLQVFRDWWASSARNGLRIEAQPYVLYLHEKQESESGVQISAAAAAATAAADCEC